MSNARFAEYATSGAFSLSLARAQVSSLAMIEGGSRGFSMSESALERKGLIEPVAMPSRVGDDDAFEWRPTYAGLLCLGLLREAGLTNGERDAVAAEVAALRAEVERCRRQQVDADRQSWSLAARLEDAERELAASRAEIRQMQSGLKFKEGVAFNCSPLVRKRDLCPELSTEDIKAAVKDRLSEASA